MGTDFKADPGQIAGLSNLTAQIGEDAAAAATFIGQHGPAAGWLSGPIIDELLPAVRQSAEATERRMGEMAAHTLSTGAELNKAAWMYHNQDQRNYAALNAQTQDVTWAGALTRLASDPSGFLHDRPDAEKAGFTAAYVSPVEMKKTEEFALAAPTSNKDDLIDLIGEVAPVLKDVNDAVKEITRSTIGEIDPLSEVLEPIPGNWTELRRIGEAYKQAGNGMEACGENLEHGTRAVADGWDGKAAVAFEDWSDRQVAAMKWEGPVGRIISDVMGEVAERIRDAAKTILEKLWNLLNSRIDFKSIEGILKFIARNIPILGEAYEIQDLARKIYHIIDTAITLVQRIRDLVEQVKKLLEFISVGNLAKDAKFAAVLTDMAQIAQVENTVNRPTEGYETGSGSTPWENQ